MVLFYLDSLLKPKGRTETPTPVFPVQEGVPRFFLRGTKILIRHRTFSTHFKYTFRCTGNFFRLYKERRFGSEGPLRSGTPDQGSPSGTYTAKRFSFWLTLLSDDSVTEYTCPVDTRRHYPVPVCVFRTSTVTYLTQRPLRPLILHFYMSEKGEKKRRDAFYLYWRRVLE